MLDKAKVLLELQKLSDNIFVDSPNLDGVRLVWELACSDPLFSAKVAKATASWPLASWEGALDQGQEVLISGQHAYTLAGIDGSQIYPDKHQGSLCFLINIGVVILHYNSVGSAQFATEPTVFADEHGYGSAVDVVNCLRQELEFNKGVAIMSQLVGGMQFNNQPLLLFDGSLIFWHLEPKEQELRTHFLIKYCQSLLELYKNKQLCAGYISLPKSKDLVNLLRFACQEYHVFEGLGPIFDRIVDTHICKFFLRPYCRSNVFMHQARLCQSYPAQVRPYFFYMHIGAEIVRVELPAWIAQDEQLTDFVAQLILDNSLKGHGYPVVLAEAHEQAVVKGPDRDFFYQLVQKVGFDRNRSLLLSQKVLKKRGIAI